ncbi:MAG: hypothetical protein KDM63_00725 [Verrucomicrobiae bacterium]|nr:hypothetical protein [Verrucomicrobiae bacterium]
MKPNFRLSNRASSPLASALVLGGLALSVVSTTQAAERRFAYSYEAQTYVPGSIEVENWVTWQDRAGSDRFDFRHEIEVGVTEKLQLGFYLVDWRHTEGGESEYHDTAIEAIYNLTNPNTDWIGSSLYGEVKFAKEFLELEGKIILQKNWGPVSLVYNVALEAEWEEEGLEETKGEVAQTLGLSYMVSPKFSVGAEMLSEVEFEDWGGAGPHALYFGPNASLRGERHWLTAAGLWEVTGTDEPDFQLRAIWGIHF